MCVGGKRASVHCQRVEIYPLYGTTTYHCPAFMYEERKGKEHNREKKKKALEEKREKKQVK